MLLYAARRIILGCTARLTTCVVVSESEFALLWHMGLLLNSGSPLLEF